MAGSGVGQRGSDTIVLHLGSKNLRFEFAHEMAPQVMPNVIAYPSTTPL
jgi:actin-related protein